MAYTQTNTHNIFITLALNLAFCQFTAKSNWDMRFFNLDESKKPMSILHANVTQPVPSNLQSGKFW